MKIWVVTRNDDYGYESHTFTKEDNACKYAYNWCRHRWLVYFPNQEMPDDWQEAYERLTYRVGFIDSISIDEHSVQPPKGPADEAYVSRAQDNYHDDGVLEVDDNAIVIMDKGGAWVQAWIWIDDLDITNKNLLKKHGYLNSESRFS